MPRPVVDDPLSVVLNMRMKRQDYTTLRAIAAQRQVSVAAVIRWAVEEYIQRRLAPPREAV